MSADKNRREKIDRSFRSHDRLLSPSFYWYVQHRTAKSTISSLLFLFSAIYVSITSVGQISRSRLLLEQTKICPPNRSPFRKQSPQPIDRGFRFFSADRGRKVHAGKEKSKEQKFQRLFGPWTFRSLEHSFLWIIRSRELSLPKK